MKKIIIALATTTALAAAMPAAAQYGGGSLDLRVDQLQTQFQAGVRSGAITRAEAMPLRQQLRQLSDLERQYAQGGFSAQERADLRNRIVGVRQGIRMAERTGDNRYDRDDRWGDGRDCPPGLEKKNNGCLPPGQVGRDDRDGRWDDDRDERGRWTDRNRDGYDDRDLNRDRRVDEREWRIAAQDDDRDGRWDVAARNDANRDGWDDRDTDRDGRWDDEADYGRDQVSGNGNRGVLGQIIDRVTGNGGLRVGQQASANLGAVPSAYRAQYRDGNGAYYRSDGRQIYQIDARTHLVARIFPMNR